jgi:hypothetical protein
MGTTEPKLPGSKLEPLGPNVGIWVPYLHPDDHPDLPYTVEVTVELQAGRLVCQSLTCHQRKGGEPVTAEGLRHMPVAAIVSRSAQKRLMWVESSGKSARPFTLQGAVRTRPFGGPSDEELRYAAGIYRLAHATGNPPTRAISEVFELPPSTAAKWVMRARERGFLGATTPGRAGEES